MIVHPETGEVLATQEQWRAALAELEARLGPVYRSLASLREQGAEEFPPTELPSPRKRTEVQERVARCPQCGRRLEEEGAATS